MIRVALIDDHDLVRAGLAALLQADDRMTVVLEESDGLAALETVPRAAPDVALVDLSLAGLGGLEVTRRLRKAAPKMGVIVVSMHADEAYVAAALEAGASGFVPKTSLPQELRDAVGAVASGHRYLAPSISTTAVAAYTETAPSGDAYEDLSPREREVLHLTLEGHTARAIGERLNLSRRTAETHRANLMRKLGVHTRHDLLRWALDRTEPLPPGGG